MMRNISRFIQLIFVLSLSIYPSWAQDAPIRYNFSGDTAEENGITVMGAGFGDYPLADGGRGSMR